MDEMRRVWADKPNCNTCGNQSPRNPYILVRIIGRSQCSCRELANEQFYNCPDWHPCEASNGND